MATGAVGSRWMGTGHARCTDAFAAGREAAGVALEGPDPRLLVVFSSQADDLPRLLAFDCIARRGLLGEEGIGVEVERLAQHAGGAPVAGFYTYGEIARTRGSNGFHNQTLVVLALA